MGNGRLFGVNVCKVAKAQSSRESRASTCRDPRKASLPANFASRLPLCLQTQRPAMPCNLSARTRCDAMPSNAMPSDLDISYQQRVVVAAARCTACLCLHLRVNSAASISE